MDPFIRYQLTEWVHKARVFVPCNPFYPCVMKHFDLFGPFIRYKLTEWAHKARVFVPDNPF